MVEPSLFGEPKRNAPVSGMNEKVTETASRLAVLEERAANLRKKTQVTEQSLIDYNQETRADLRALNERLTELARKVEEVHEKIDAMSGELELVGRKHELKVLERYLDLWQPLSFVTREEAKILIKDALEATPKK